MDLNSSIIYDEKGERMAPEEEKQYSKDILRTTSMGFVAVPIMGENSSKLFKSILGFPFNDKTEYISSRGGVYFSHTDRIKEKTKLIEFIQKDNKYIDKIYKKCLLDGEDILKFSKLFKFKDFKKTSDKKLKSIAKKHFDKLFIMSGHLPYPLAIESYLEQNLISEIKEKTSNYKNAQEYFQILTTPIKSNEYFIEQIELLKIAFLCEKEGKITEDIERRIINHLKKFSQCGVKRGIGDFWTRNNIIERINNLKLKNIKKELVRMEKIPKLNNKNVEKVLKLIKAGPRIKRLSKWSRMMAFIRTYRIDALSDSFANMFSVFEEIGRRCGLSVKEVIACPPNEIVSMDFSDKKIIKERAEYFLIRAENGRMFYTFGKFAAKVEKELSRNEGNDGEVKGKTAFRGRVTGLVKVVLSNRELNKVKAGDILIASMTTTDYVPAMEKAAAVVTNEGGMTCHAAIIAREMKKPCIIGTKFATDVLKDGDEVEVDANKGTVKILNGGRKNNI